MPRSSPEGGGGGLDAVRIEGCISVSAISRKVVGYSARVTPKGIVGGSEFTEWQERPWRYVCEC